MDKYLLRRYLLVSLVSGVVGAAVCDFMHYVQETKEWRARPSNILCDGSGRMYTEHGVPTLAIFGDTEITPAIGCPTRWTPPKL